MRCGLGACGRAELSGVTELYLCGPMRLLDAARQAGAGAGRPATSLRYETFANSGRHAPERFWVRVPSHGVEIVVPENKTMLDALNEAGVEVMWDCLRGECGLCAVDIVEVDGGIDHQRRVPERPPETGERQALHLRVARVRRGRGDLHGLPAGLKR